MPRDQGLEALLNDDLGNLPGLTQKRMFGGWAWLLHGHLLCAARAGSIMIRLGKGNDAWALATTGITTVVMSGREMKGWVRATPEAYASDELRQRLLRAAISFVRSLPPKHPGPHILSRPERAQPQIQNPEPFRNPVVSLIPTHARHKPSRAL